MLGSNESMVIQSFATFYAGGQYQRGYQGPGRQNQTPKSRTTGLQY